MKPRKPNFLLFCTDQQRADHLGCMGHPDLKTPNIDRIANEGVTFKNCYTSCPACMPARATMFTGLTNRASGCRTNGVSLPEDVPTLPGLLADSGYRTHSVGKLHLKSWPKPRSLDITEHETPEENPERLIHWSNGKIKKSPDDYYGFQTQDLVTGHVSYINGDYKVWLEENHPGASELYYTDNPGDLGIPPELHYNKWIADKTIGFLEDNADENPFFLWCSFPDPHFPFGGVTKWVDEYRDLDIELPQCAIEIPQEGQSETLTTLGEGQEPLDQNYLKECTRQTYGMISHIDEQIGRVMESLEKLGLAENTVVVFISDHGEQLGEHGLMYKGHYPYDGHSKIPFLCKVPWAEKRGIVVDDVVSMLDLVPTILDFANVPQYEDPMVNETFREQAAPFPAPLPGESLKEVLQNGKDPLRKNALVEFDTEIFFRDYNPAFDLFQMRMLVTNDYKLVYYSPTNETMLFDRHNDPEETRNLASDPDKSEVVKDMLIQMLQEISRTESRLPRRISGS